MRIENQTLLKEFRSPGRCEWCRRGCSVREPAHLWTRGAGRLDIRINLVALGSTPLFQCFCHSDHHNGIPPTRKDLLVRVAERERTTPEEIEAVVYMLRRLPKAPRLEQVYAEWVDMGPAKRLAESVLVEAGIFGNGGK